jgi:hypothetical protein
MEVVPGSCGPFFNFGSFASRGSEVREVLGYHGSEAIKTGETRWDGQTATFGVRRHLTARKVALPPASGALATTIVIGSHEGKKKKT